LYRREAEGAAAPPPGGTVDEGEAVPARDLARAPVAHEDWATEFARLRVAVVEAYERSAASLLAALARDVLARELLLAPADLDALVASALASFAASEPVGLAVSASDATARLRTSLPVRVDPALRPGDVILELKDGALESSLAFRLSSALVTAGAA